MTEPLTPEAKACAPKRGHLLTITKSAHWHEDDPDWEWRITCLAPGLCGGWQECDEVFKHRAAVRRARHEGRVLLDHPPACDLDGDPNDDEELLFHGVWHTYRYGWGWTVPFEGCVVSAHDDVSEFVWQIAADHGPGEHLVADDWDDGSICALDVLPPLDAIGGDQ